jgi:septal ring factor EnvC (AmiA/AmiB activator)
MNDQDFQQKLGNLMASIQHLPTDKKAEIERLAEETKARRARMQATIKGLQESLDHLRLSVKYMAFDLEATRRENEYLRKLLNGDKDQPDAGGDD